jgi:hypothetical protein
MRWTGRGIGGVVAAAVGLLMLAAQPKAATLLVNGSGKLTGAQGVNVSGNLFDVTFQDASCNTVFPGCSGFAFSSDLTMAGIAAQALLDQVFLDVAAGAFETHPELTLGCSNNISGTAFVPYASGGGFVSYRGGRSTP